MKTNTKISTLLGLGLFISSIAFAETLTYTSYTVNADGTLTPKVVTYDTDSESVYTSPTTALDTDWKGLYIGSTRSTNTATQGGGAITATGTYTLTGDFINNTYTRSGNSNSGGGGAVFGNGSDSNLTIYGDFIGNSFTSTLSNATGVGGGAIATTGTVTVYGNFIANSASGGSNRGGGAIYGNGATAINVYNGSFIGNSSEGNNNQGGGAIYLAGTGSINLYAESSNIYFTGNTSSGVSNAIYTAASAATINFNASENYSIIVNDGINTGATVATSNININSGTTEFNNSVSTYIINIKDGAILKLGSYEGTKDLYGDGAYVDNVWTGTVVADSTASITKCSINLEDGSTLILTDGVSFSSNTWSIADGATATIALDIEDIFGSFEISLDFSSDSSGLTAIETVLASGDFDIIIGDIALDVIYSDSTYSVDSDLLSDFAISITGSVITFSGIVVPEPSTYAMLLGVIALGFAAYRRRK